MHMISKKDLNSAEMDTLTTTSRSPTTVITANGEVQTMKKPQFMSKNWIFLTMKVLEDTPAVYPLESFAMNTDTLMNGSTVKNHISLKTVFGYNATQRTSLQSRFLFCQRVLPPAFPLQHPWHLQRQEIDHPTSSSSSSTSPTMTVSSDSETRARWDLCGIDSYPVIVSSKHVERQARGDLCSSGAPEEDLLTKPTKNPKPNKNEDHDLERWVKFWHTRITARIQKKLVDDRVPERRDSHASSSHEVSLEPTSKRNEDLGTHSVFSHFPKTRWPSGQRTSAGGEKRGAQETKEVQGENKRPRENAPEGELPMDLPAAPARERGRGWALQSTPGDRWGAEVKLAGKKQNINPMWKILNTEVDLEEPTSFLDHVSGMYSKTMWNKQRYCWQLQNHVWIQNFCRSNWKITMLGKSAYLFVVLWHARSCQEMVERYCELAKRTTQQLYKVSTPCIDDHHFKEEELKSVGELSKVCSQIVLKCFFWHVLEDLIFYGQWTDWHDRSQNGPNLVTHDYLAWYLTFITHVNTNNIVMWVTLLNNAGWDCFKTPILREILKIQILLRAEHCAFLEVIHLFQSVGCVRNKLQFRTVQQNQKSFLWMQDWDWMVFPHLICGIWSLRFLGTRIRLIKNRTTC